MHTLLAGRRRIGKTTVCNAVCARLRDADAFVVEIEVPERSDATALLQLIVDVCSRASLAATGRRVLRATQPLLHRWLEEQGIPLDLSDLGGSPAPLTKRAILSLPRRLAAQAERPVVLFLDELQRAVGYEDASELLGDLIDLYGGSADVVLLVDGSEERVLGDLLGPPVHLGKLCDRLDLSPTIALDVWRTPLRERFARAGMHIADQPLEQLLRYGGGQPYRTIAAARYAALSVRKLAEGGASRPTLDAFSVQMGIDEAERHLRDDDV